MARSKNNSGKGLRQNTPWLRPLAGTLGKRPRGIRAIRKKTSGTPQGERGSGDSGSPDGGGIYLSQNGFRIV